MLSFCLGCSTLYAHGLEVCPHCGRADRVPAGSSEQVELDGPFDVHLVDVEGAHRVKGYTASVDGIAYKVGSKNFAVAWSEVDHVAAADEEPAAAGGEDTE